jgi:porin
MRTYTAFLAAVMIVVMNHPLYSEDEEDENGRAVQLGAAWTGDMAHSLSGGLRQGSVFLGMATFSVSLDAESAGLWKNGFFAASAVRTLGAMPSAELFGDAQVTSNIEAGNHTFLMELWISQRFGSIEITAGLQDMNAIFALSESGGLFLNSSFGIMPVITGNIPAPVFPLTSPGVTVVAETGNYGSFAVALFDGRPVPFENNPFNTRWKFASGDGVLAIAEYRLQVETEGLPGIYKAGLFSHNHLIGELLGNELPDTLCGPTIGWYMMADQTFWQNENRKASFFMQAGYSPSRESFIDLNASFGVNITGMIRGRVNDVAGLAVTTGRFNGLAGSETAIEITYKAHFSENIFLQPDLQYIINPSGRSSGIPHCLAGFLRLGVTL